MKRIWEWFDDIRNGWGAAGIVTGLFILGQAIILNRWTYAGWPRPSLGAAVAGIVMGVGLIRKQRWARWVGFAWLGLGGLVQVINCIFGGWSAGRIASLLILAVACGFYYWQLFWQPWGEDEEKKDDKPFLSLVLLFREPRFLDATILASLASRAWGLEVTAKENADEPTGDEGHADDDSPDAEEPEASIVGQPPVFMAIHPSAMCIIHHWDRPYFDEPEKAAASIVELRARQAVQMHQAWTSVDVLHWFGDGDATAGSYRLIARLLAELADDNVLAVIDVQGERIYCYDPETERKLRSDNPLAELREGYYAPIISASSDDPQMQAAVAEARRRWPEFVAAFEAREPDDTAFAIKAPFGEGDCVEFMWAEVTSIENETIYGVLLNDPANVPNLKSGDRVTVPVADLNDFLCKINDEAVGGFTMKVLTDRAKQPPQAKESEDGDE